MLSKPRYRVIAETCMYRMPAWIRGVPHVVGKRVGLGFGCSSGEDAVIAALAVFWDAVVVTSDLGIWYLLAAVRMLLGVAGRGRIALVHRAGCDEYERSPPPPMEESLVELVGGEWRRVVLDAPKTWEPFVGEALCGLRAVLGDNVEEKLRWPREPDLDTDPAYVVCTPDAVGACIRYANALKPLYRVRAAVAVYTHASPRWKNVEHVYLPHPVATAEYARDHNAVLVTNTAWLQCYAAELGVKTMTPHELREHTNQLVRNHPLLR